MALIKYEAPLEEVRGSIGGIVYSGGRTCTIARGKVIKVGQVTRLQVRNQAHWSYLTDAWIKHLSDQDRADWGAYSRHTHWENRFGDTIHIGAIACFLRLNATRLAYSLPPRWHAPLDFGRADDGELSFHAYHTTRRIVIPEPDPPWHVSIANDALFIAQGMSAHIGNVGIPSRFRGLVAIHCTAEAPPTWPVDVLSRWPLNANQRITLRVFYQDYFFRTSLRSYFTACTEAPP